MITHVTERNENQMSEGGSVALHVGLALCLCIYYLNYGAGFDEGQIEAASPFTMLGRLLSIVLVVWSLKPFRWRFDVSILLVFLYVVAATNYFLSIIISGTTNDALFVNTLIQLPVIVALSATTQRIDHARWFRFIGIILSVQVGGDVIVEIAGRALWNSGAFIGGVGNPSSFGFLCTLLVTFYIFHPQAGSLKWIVIPILSFGAFKSQSLFSVIALTVVYFLWMIQRWRRLIVGGFAVGIIAVSMNMSGCNTNVNQISFTEHKLCAAGALIGLANYDVESSESVSLRTQIHYQTLAAIEDEPYRLLYGHLEGKQYWPMDSQILTYLGSFGVIVLIAFLGLHVTWLRWSFYNKIINEKFTLISLILFGFIFTTNRILDYFPIATIYFLLISMAVQNNIKKRRFKNKTLL